MQPAMQSEPYKNYDKDFIATHEVSPAMIMSKENSSSTKADEKRHHPLMRAVAWTLLVVFVLISAIGVYMYKNIRAEVNPGTLPLVIDIPKGSSLQTVTNILKDNELITSPLLFRVLMIMGGQEQAVKNGEYTFNRPMTLAETIDKLVNAKYEYIPVRLTIHEGENGFEIAQAVAALFPKLVEADVYARIKEKEGRLFPETYIFAPFATIDEIVKTIDKEYEKRIAVFKNEIASSSKSELEILTIASILEREVPRKSDMKIVSGIIQNRLAKGMPLQMDSTLGFITGKASLQLVTDDLKIDSPYNTYVNKGLPPGPIGNPGDVAIEAALNPESNKYFFFLSDKNGDNHYAITYAEHLKNRKLYLGK